MPRHAQPLQSSLQRRVDSSSGARLASDMTCLKICVLMTVHIVQNWFCLKSFDKLAFPVLHPAQGRMILHGVLRHLHAASPEAQWGRRGAPG